VYDHALMSVTALRDSGHRPSSENATVVGALPLSDTALVRMLREEEADKENNDGAREVPAPADDASA
jgi:hypothetical protein